VFKEEFRGGVEPSRTVICWIFEWEDQEISLEGVGKDWNCGYGEGKRVGAMKESVDFISTILLGRQEGQ